MNNEKLQSIARDLRRIPRASRARRWADLSSPSGYSTKSARSAINDGAVGRQRVESKTSCRELKTRSSPSPVRVVELARPRKTSHVSSTRREGRARRARIGSAGGSCSSERGSAAGNRERKLRIYAQETASFASRLSGPLFISAIWIDPGDAHLAFLLIEQNGHG